MHLDCISLIPFPADSSASPPKAAPVWGTNACLGTTATCGWSSCLLLGVSGCYRRPPALPAPVQVPPLKMLIFQKYNTNGHSVLWNLLGAKNSLDHYGNSILMGISHSFAKHAQTYLNSAVEYTWAHTCPTCILHVNYLNSFLEAGEQCYKSKYK